MPFESKSVLLKNSLKLEISHVAVSDAEEVIRYLDTVAGETDFLTFGRGEFGMTLEQEAQYIAGLEGGTFNFMLKGVIEGRIVSIASINRPRRARISHAGDLGITVLHEFWGKGVGLSMCEAVIAHSKKVGVTKINLITREDNLSAIRLYERVGFLHEGASVRGNKIDGKYYKDIRMGYCVE